MLLALIVVATSSAPVVGAEPVERPGLVVAGGVSLGAYQAGMVYFFNEHHLQQGHGGLPIAAGTSAGAVNASVGAFAACAESQPHPEDSVFFRVWVPLGIGGEPSLYAAGAVTARSIFDPKAVEAAADRFVDWMHEPHTWRRCKTVLGVTVTRLTPRSVALTLPDGATATLPRAASQHGERFVVEVRTSPGQEPTVMHHPLPEPVADLHPHLGAGEPSDPIEMRALIDAIVASGAFPVAFPPRTVVVRLPRADGSLGPPQPTSYLDGGVYANVPLELAVQLDAWADRPDPKYLLVHPELTPPFVLDRALAPPTSNLASMLMRFFGDVLDTSFQKGLIEGLLSAPELRAPETKRLAVPPRRTVTASEHMSAFLGFFDTSFREFDFYLGMLDARAALRARGEQLPRLQSPTFDCFAAWDDASQGFEREVSTLPTPCSSTSPRLVALLRASLAYKSWFVAQDPIPSNEVQTDRWFETLNEVGFSPSGDELRRAVRSLLGDALSRLGAKQATWIDAAMIDVGGPIALNELIYDEPEAILALGAHWDRGFELALGARPGLSWLRLDLGLRAVAIATRLQHRRLGRRTGWMPTAHAHVAWLPSTSPWIQIEPFAGPTVALPLRGFLGRPVAARLGIDAGIHWVAAQRLYVTTGASGFLYDHFFDGYQASASRVTSRPVQLNLALGVRLFP